MELRTVIVGNSYRPLDAQQRFFNLETGENLVLVREPENPHDANAIAVYSDDGFHLGYIPRTMNRELADALREGRKFAATFDADINRLYIEEVEAD